MQEARRYGASEASAALIHDVLWDARIRFPDGVPIPPKVDMDRISSVNERACDLEEIAQRASVRRGILSGLVTIAGAAVVIIDIAGTAPTAGASIGSVALGVPIFGVGLTLLDNILGGES